MSKTTRRNLVNFLVLVMAAIAVVPSLIGTAEWVTMNYVVAGALALAVVWFVVDLARSTTGSLR
ncbi:hypothetical protein GCM10027271_56390 [Saccharopolyspora gloriosae]|uniref:Uncharacterized protein n=1 Tax=Saccharopolyspora gloriosae TaxID=455344 RepID=A0A840N7W6_9PSEU|nr:hypothetical protein [Saccharopolyspora gloriosae]MBB5067724.1 hypothetical protein [Saccharopolyspora gloriosae]